MHISGFHPHLPQLISNTSEVHFNIKPLNFHVTGKGLQPMCIRELFLCSLSLLDLEYCKYEYDVFSTDPVHSPVALAIHMGSRALYNSLPEMIFVGKKKASILDNLLCCDYFCFKAILELLCDHLLCTLCTNISSDFWKQMQ